MAETTTKQPKQPRSSTIHAETEPPPPGTYKFVIRRTDRKPRPFKLVLDYARPAFVTRAIDHRGVVAPTLFLETWQQMKQARRRGYRKDITAEWFADLAKAQREGGTPKPAAKPIPDNLESLTKADLVTIARSLDLSTDGKKAEIIERINAART